MSEAWDKARAVVEKRLRLYGIQVPDLTANIVSDLMDAGLIIEDAYLPVPPPPKFGGDEETITLPMSVVKEGGVKFFPLHPVGHGQPGHVPSFDCSACTNRMWIGDDL